MSNDITLTECKGTGEKAVKLRKQMTCPDCFRPASRIGLPKGEWREGVVVPSHSPSAAS